MIEHKTGQRGTDEAFIKLMTLSGDALLKLLGMEADVAASYQFRATVLKQKRLFPDIEGWSLRANIESRALLEFQGYKYPFVRYNLAAKVLMSCEQNDYQGPVFAGIIYTDTQYQEAALPLTPFGRRSGCQFDDCLVEVVISEFSEEQLKAIDPRLVILAPLTLKPNTNPEVLKSKGRVWQEEIYNNFPEPSRHEALEIMGLFAVTRFSSFDVKEIIQMLNLDPNPNWLFDKVSREGEQIGEAKMLTRLLQRRFGNVPEWVREKIAKAKLPSLEEWSLRFVDANSLDAIFSDKV